jgi:hypothetical protein
MERVLPLIVEIAAQHPGAHRLYEVHNACSCRRPARALAPLFPEMAPCYPRRASRVGTWTSFRLAAVCPSCRDHRQAGLFGISRIAAGIVSVGKGRLHACRHRCGNRRLRARDHARCGRSRFRVVIVEDALCSSSDAGHDA